MTDNPTTQSSSTPENGTAVIPDSPIGAVTLDRVGDIMTAENLMFKIDDISPSIAEGGRVLRTGFSNAAITMHIRNNHLLVDAMWRGQFDPAQGSDVLTLTNQWNSENFNPTLRFFESAQHTLAIAAFRQLDITHGASRNQLGSFLTTTFDAILTAFKFIETTHPETVTWEEPTND